MVRIFVYNNCLVSKHELVLKSVDKKDYIVLKSKIYFRVPYIFKILGYDLSFTLGDRFKKDDDCPRLYLVLDTDNNKLVESFSNVLDIILSFA